MKKNLVSVKVMVQQYLQIYHGIVGIGYTRSLAPADFSGAVFTCAHFQKVAQISSLCDFHYITEGIPSLMRF